MNAATGKLSCVAVLGVLFFTLGGGPTAANEPSVRTDRFGAPLPKSALLRLGVTRFRTEGSVSSVAFSQNGKWLAGGDSDGNAYLWEASTGKVIHQLDAGENSATVVFSRDSESLVTRTSKGEVRLWDMPSGKLLSSFQRQATEYFREQLLLSSDRSRLIAVGDGNGLVAVRNGKHSDSYVIGDKLPELHIDLLELPSGKLLKRLTSNTPETLFSDAALSPDGKLLAVGIRAYKSPAKLLRLIDATTGELVREIRGEGEGWFLSVTFTRDGKMLALGSKDEIALVDVATGKLVGQLTAKMNTIGLVCFTPDAKKLVSHSHDNKVRLWDLATKKVLGQFDAEADGYSELLLPTKFREKPAHDAFFGKATCTASSPDGKIVAISESCCVQLWDVTVGKQLFPDQTPADGWSNVTFSPDGRLLLVGNWQHCRLWDSRADEVRKELPTGAAHAVFSPDGKQIAFAHCHREKDNSAPVAYIWDVASEKVLFRLEHPRKERFTFEKLAFGPNGRTLLTLSTHVENAGYPNAAMVHRWETSTGKLLGSVHRSDTNAWPSVIAPDGPTAVIVLMRGLLLTDVQNDEDLWRREEGTPEGRSGYPFFSPDSGFLFAWSNGGYVAMWEIATRSVIGRISVCRDGNIKLDKWPVWDRNSKEEPAIPAKQSGIEALAVSPDGRFVATSEQFNYRDWRGPRPDPFPPPVIRIWEAATGKEVQRLEGFRSAPRSLAFSPDGQRLASAFFNDTVLVWDVSQLSRPPGTPKKLPVDEMERCWEDLASPDGVKGYRAITAFQEAAAVDYLARHVRPVSAADAKHVQRLIRNLDSEQFDEREASTKELMTLAPRFKEALRKAFGKPPSEEVKRRLEAILAKAPRQLPSESLRALRSIQTLERIGSAAALQVINAVADGEPDAYETLAAQTASQRLTWRLKNSR